MSQRIMVQQIGVGEFIPVPVQRMGVAASYPEHFELPDHRTSLSKGVDLRAAIPVPRVTVSPGESATIPTGIAVAVPSGYELQIRPHVGLAAQPGVTVLNSPEKVGDGFGDEVVVGLVNHGPTDFCIACGDRIAQAVIVPIIQVTLSPVTAFDRPTLRAISLVGWILVGGVITLITLGAMVTALLG